MKVDSFAEGKRINKIFKFITTYKKRIKYIFLLLITKKQTLLDDRNLKVLEENEISFLKTLHNDVFGIMFERVKIEILIIKHREISQKNFLLILQEEGENWNFLQIFQKLGIMQIKNLNIFKLKDNHFKTINGYKNAQKRNY